MPLPDSPTSPAALREWATVARMGAAWLYGVATILALFGIFHAVPPWWTCWVFGAPGLIASRYATRLERHARAGGR